MIDRDRQYRELMGSIDDLSKSEFPTEAKDFLFQMKNGTFVMFASLWVDEVCSVLGSGYTFELFYRKFSKKSKEKAERYYNGSC